MAGRSTQLEIALLDGNSTQSDQDQQHKRRTESEEHGATVRIPKDEPTRLPVAEGQKSEASPRLSVLDRLTHHTSLAGISRQTQDRADRQIIRSSQSIAVQLEDLIPA